MLGIRVQDANADGQSMYSCHCRLLFKVTASRTCTQLRKPTTSWHAAAASCYCSTATVAHMLHACTLRPNAEAHGRCIDVTQRR